MALPPFKPNRAPSGSLSRATGTGGASVSWPTQLSNGVMATFKNANATPLSLAFGGSAATAVATEGYSVGPYGRYDWLVEAGLTDYVAAIATEGAGNAIDFSVHESSE